MIPKVKIKIPRITLSQTVELTFIALLCFFIGTFVVLGFKGWQFHEVAYRPAAIIDSILARYENNDSLLIAACDSPQYKDTLRAEIKFRRYQLSRLPDSEMQKALVEKQLFINNDAFNSQCLVRFNYTDSIKKEDRIKWRDKRASRDSLIDYRVAHKDDNFFRWCLFYVTDTEKSGAAGSRSKVVWDYYFSHSNARNKPMPPVHLQQAVRMKVKNYPENIDFFVRYPGFLLWAMLIIIQFGLFPVLALCTWVIIIDFKKQFPNLYGLKENKWQTLKYVLLSGTIISIFACIGFYAFFNPNLIRSGLFHRHMSGIMVSVSVLTCLGGNACFTGLMLISGSKFDVQKGGTATEEDIKLLNGLNDLFGKLLVISSIILCIIVLTTGALYNTLNKMEFIRKVTNDIGYSPMGYHYAILFAGLCSILLVLFFVPAKMRLVAIENELRELSPNESRIGKAADLAAITKSVVVVGLPLITGLIHFIISALAS